VSERGNELKILIVCSDFPYPANHGGRVDTWGRIKALHALGVHLDLVVCGNPQQPTPEELDMVRQYADRIAFAEAKGRLPQLLRWLPYQVEKRETLRTVHLGREDYNFILLEGDAMYAIVDNPAVMRMKAKLVLRVHNDEVTYFQALARSTGKWMHKVYYYLESLKFKWLQGRILKRIDTYMFISSKEHEKFAALHPEKRSLFLPPPVQLEQMAAYRPETRKVVFIGSLFMPNNREAIEWYLHHIHPRMLHHEEYRFVIAGNSRGQRLTWLDKFDLDRVEVYDTPESLDDIYDSGCLFVNPMRNGAGVKLKTIEAIQYGLPVLSTSIGCEGTGLQDGVHILIADEPQLFYEKLSGLYENPAMRKRLLAESQQFIRAQYDHQGLLRDFLVSDTNAI